MKIGSFSTPNLKFPKVSPPKFKTPKDKSITNSLKKYKPSNMFSDLKTKVPDPIKKHIPDNIGNGKGLDVEKMINSKTYDIEGMLSKNNKTEDVIGTFSGKNLEDFMPNQNFNNINMDLLSKKFKF